MHCYHGNSCSATATKRQKFLVAIKGEKKGRNKEKIINENYFKCIAIFMNHPVKGCEFSQENLRKDDHGQENASFYHNGPNHSFIRKVILQRNLLAVC